MLERSCQASDLCQTGCPQAVRNAPRGQVTPPTRTGETPKGSAMSPRAVRSTGTKLWLRNAFPALNLNLKNLE